MNYKVIDIDTWYRKEQYEFFRSFAEPFTGVVVEVNVASLYDLAKSTSQSFFQLYLHRCLKAVNQTRALCLRIIGDEVLEYETIDASAVIMRSDRSFGFSLIQHTDDFSEFSRNVWDEKNRIENDRSLFPPTNPTNVIHFSAMPWIKFTGLSHARNYGTQDSCPKISVGKVFERGGEQLMPVSVHVHHALVDGIDMAEFIQRYQEELQKP